MDPMTQGQLKEWFVMLVAWGLVAWVAYLVASMVRRKQKNDMQKVLLEKFSSAHDFAEFMQSPAGQKYVIGFADAVTSPRNSILSSVQWGIVLLLLGPALITVSMRHNLWVLDLLGMSSTCLGVGFLVSAAVSYVLMKKTDLGEKE